MGDARQENPLTIDLLVSQVFKKVDGDVGYHWVRGCVTNYVANNKKRPFAKLTVGIEDELARDAMGIGPEKYQPVILWLPADKVAEVIAEHTAKYGPATGDQPEKP